MLQDSWENLKHLVHLSKIESWPSACQMTIKEWWQEVIGHWYRDPLDIDTKENNFSDPCRTTHCQWHWHHASQWHRLEWSKTHQNPSHAHHSRPTAKQTTTCSVQQRRRSNTESAWAHCQVDNKIETLRFQCVWEIDAHTSLHRYSKDNQA